MAVLSHASGGRIGNVQTWCPNNQQIVELLRLAGISTKNSKARSWLGSALSAVRSRTDARAPQPTPAKHNAPLDKVARANERLVAALAQLKRHPQAHLTFWRSPAFGGVYSDQVERTDVLATLTHIRQAASQARLAEPADQKNWSSSRSLT